MRAARLALAAALACALLPHPAFASVFEMFGAGPRAMSMAGAMTAAAYGGEASFHNPALLASAKVAGAWFGMDTTNYNLDVQMARPVCTGDYLACRAQYINGFSSRAPQLPKDSSGFALGWHYPVGGIFRGKVAFGASLALPVGRIIRISGPDPQTPNFGQYEGMPDRIAFLFAASARITDWWWVGIGTQVLAVLNAKIALGLDATNNTMDHASIAIGLDCITDWALNEARTELRIVIKDMVSIYIPIHGLQISTKPQLYLELQHEKAPEAQSDKTSD